MQKAEMGSIQRFFSFGHDLEHEADAARSKYQDALALPDDVVSKRAMTGLKKASDAAVHKFERYISERVEQKLYFNPATKREVSKANLRRRLKCEG